MGRKTPFVRTPSDRVVQLVDPVAWEASVGAAIHVGCEAYNALGYVVPNSELERIFF